MVFWLVPYITPNSEKRVMSSKNIESEIMDQTKSQENERLKQEIVSLRQQMLEMY